MCDELARLKWQCRRGMLELDLLLEDYLDNQYLSATDNEKNKFHELLKCEDDELLMRLLKQVD